jgi:Mn-containing catalase
MLLETGTEEIGHIEMLSTAVAMNLEGAPSQVQDESAKNPMMAAILGGMNPRHYLSAGLAALPENSNGVPFNASHVYASGNIVGDMYSNVAAETTGRVLATRLYHMTDDPGMKDMLSFLIARDTMHQQQWLAVIEELGGYETNLPVPNSFPQGQELQEVSYKFMSTAIDGIAPPEGRWTQGPSLDGKGQFSVERMRPRGQEPKLAPPRPDGFAQTQQMQDAGGIIQTIKEKLVGE